MALPYPSNSLQPEGKLEIEKITDVLYDIYFTPPEVALPTYDKNPKAYRRRVIEVDKEKKTITIVPFRVWSGSPMSNRYLKLAEICFDLPLYAIQYLEEDFDIENVLSAIPESFTQDINYGFGFKKHYGQIVSILEQMDVKKLFVSSKEKMSIDVANYTATVNERDLNHLRRIADNIIRRSQKITSRLKRDALNEAFFTALSSGNEISTNAGKISKDEFAKLIGKTNPFVEGGATLTEQKDAISVIRKNYKKIMEQQPQELIKLKNDLELVNLEQLIQKFEAMMAKKVNEAQWQQLLQQNPFIINMAFGIPAITIQGQASVGGRRLSGGGEKIADFLVKNSLSNNTAIVEIKIPSTSLVNSKAYRSGVHGPSQELSSAVSQVLDQVYLFQKEINSIKVNSKIYDIESYFVHGILIIGSTPSSPDEHKSFEYFRGNSKSVQILTFNELLEKLKSLHQFLLPDEPAPKPSVSLDDEDELPF